MSLSPARSAQQSPTGGFGEAQKGGCDAQVIKRGLFVAVCLVAVGAGNSLADIYLTDASCTGQTYCKAGVYEMTDPDGTTYYCTVSSNGSYGPDCKSDGSWAAVGAERSDSCQIGTCGTDFGP